MAVPNGMNPVPGAPYAPGGGIFPNAGHHSDMQHIWKLVSDLSAALQENREKYEELQESIARASTRPPASPQSSSQQQHQPRENGLVNGDASSAASYTSPPLSGAQAHQIHHQQETISALRTELASANHTVSTLHAAAEESSLLLQTYESALGEITARLRSHAYEQQNHTIMLHAHYNRLLEESRNETVQAQVTHQKWQAVLGGLSRGVRSAYREVGEKEGYWRAKVAGLRDENKVLRRLAGWEDAEDSSDSGGDGDEDRDGNLDAEEGHGALAGDVGPSLPQVMLRDGLRHAPPPPL